MKIRTLITVAALLIAAATGRAAQISDVLSLYQNGGLTDLRTVFETQEPMAAPAVMDHNLANGALAGHIFLLLEEGSNPADYQNRALWSDMVGIVNTGTQASPSYGLGFLSDPLNEQLVFDSFGVIVNGTPTIFVDSVFVESAGLVIDVTHFISPAFLSQGYTATFTSDVDAVPDGGLTISLLGFALVGVESLRRKLSK